MSERVLIIDDEENIRQMIRLTLETEGYEVGEAGNGMEAFFVLGGDAAWDVVLLDQRMPELEGTEVLRRLRVLTPSASVVMMTAFASVDLAVEAMKLGATDFIRKPMTPEVLRNAVVAAKSKAARNPGENIDADEGGSRTRTVTMNGFTILRPSDISSLVSQRPNERAFLVRKPDGSEQTVVVEISNEAMAAAAVITEGEPIEKSLWTTQAETFLSDFIWTDGDIPRTGRLVLKGVDRDELAKLKQAKR